MSGQNKYKLKLLYIIDILNQKTDENHILTASQLCDELAKFNITAERKSVYHDINVLRDFGCEIVHLRSPKNGFFIASRYLELSEIRLLVDAVQAADFIPEGKSVDIISKLLKLTSRYNASAIMSSVNVKRGNKCGSEDILHITDVLHEAIESGKKVSLKYGRRTISDKTLTAEYKEFRLSPYALIWANDHYYLVANNSKYENLMHLRVDRIQKVRILSEEARPVSEVSQYSDKFDRADYAEKVFNMFSGEVMDIELVCSNSLIEDISDRFGTDAKYMPHNPGMFLLSARVGVSEGLVSWLFQFGNKIKIKSPELLRDIYAKKAAELAANAGILKI